MVSGKLASVPVSGSDGEEGQVRRCYLEPETLLERPEPGVSTMADLFDVAHQRWGTKKMIGTREILDEIKEEKKVRKTVGNEEVEETKTWTFYKLSDYHYITLNELFDRVSMFATGLSKLGLVKGMRFSVFASTAPSWQVAAQASFRLGMTLTTAYDTLGPSGLQVSLEEPEVVGIFTNAQQLDVVASVVGNCPDLRVVVYDGDADPAVVDQIQSVLAARPGGNLVTYDALLQLGGEGAQMPKADVQPSDVACIMYTSGSTGPPKGVILTHGNLIATVAAVKRLMDPFLSTDDNLLAYLPLAHILEFIVECYLIFRGLTIGYGRVKTLTATSVRDSLSDLMAFRPSLMVGVPAVWELIRKGMLAKVHQMGALKQDMFHMGMWAKRNRVPVLSSIADRVVFKAAKQQTGGRMRLALSGGAPISRETHEFLRLCLVEIVQGYGLTESSAMCAILTPDFFQFGSVGVPMPSVEVKLRDVPEAGYLSTNNPPQGEVLIRGPSVTQGYFKRPELTQEAITPDGWLLTGDVAQWNEDGTISLIDRKKNLVKLSGGEYIALERLESTYKSCNLVSNICVHASSEAKQPMAVVFPREDFLRDAVKASSLEHLKTASLEDLCSSRDMVSLVLQHVNKSGKAEGFAPMELLQTVVLVPEELPMTAAQKIQRKEVENIYADRIEKVYP
ncbi:long-chain-fatty-acid--CoA ligase [Malassezia sp. CBS 17886]|nr:long-chain-fatty-acid--CoA ligase [Malassezia sp. CBS 17886]